MSKVILINAFEIPQGKEDECLVFWEKAAEYMRRQPGFIATRLHRAIAPGARFPLINMAEWESRERLEAAVSREEFKNLIAPYMEICPHYPGLYEVVRT